MVACDMYHQKTAKTRQKHSHLSWTSSAPASGSRFTAGAAEFLNEPVPRAALTYGEPSRFDRMPPFEGAMADRLPKCQP
jgi:hypothetical protein